MMKILSMLLLAAMAQAQAAQLMAPAYTGLDVSPSKVVTSLREARFANVVEQKEDFSCAAAALATLLRYGFARDTSEGDVIRGMLVDANQDVVRQQGFSLLDVKRYVKAQGLRASGFVVGPEKLPGLRIPALVMLDINGYKHFVVLRAANADTVYVADPAVGNRTIDMATFSKQWNGVMLAVAGPGYRIDNPLHRIQPTLSARGSVNSAQPTAVSDLVEYGFLYSDFF